MSIKNTNNKRESSRRERSSFKKRIWSSLRFFSKKRVITEEQINIPVTDVIINFSNTELIHLDGFSKIIAQKAGEALIRESDKINFVPLGNFVFTQAGNLQAKLVCHIPIVCHRTNRKATIEDLDFILRRVLARLSLMNYFQILIPLEDLKKADINKQDFLNRFEELKNEFRNFTFEFI